MWVVRYAWLEIGVGGQICVVGNRCGWSDIPGWKLVWVVRYAWLEIGVGGQIWVVGNRCGWSDTGGWK